MQGQERDLRLYALAMTVERKLGFLPAIAGRHRHPVDHAESARQPGIASREQIAIVTILLDQELRDRAQRRLLRVGRDRSEEHKSELQSLMRTSSPVFCLKT